MTIAKASPTILLLPGNMCDGRLWAGNDIIIIETLQKFSLNVIRVDFEGDATIHAMADRALQSCDGPIIPIGFSMGGIVALQMVRDAPDRLVAVGLMDTNAKADSRGSERLRQQQDVLAGHLERVVIEELKPNYLARLHAGNQAMLELLRDMAIKLGPEVFLAQSEALRTREDLTPQLSRLTVPVFMACGAEDTLCSPQLHTDMSQHIQDVTLHVVPDAGHLLPLEQPAFLADLLSDFLTKKLGLPYV